MSWEDVAQRDVSKVMDILGCRRQAKYRVGAIVQWIDGKV